MEAISGMLAAATDPAEMQALRARLVEGFTGANVLTYGGAALLAYMAWEQVQFRWWRRGAGKSLPGPDYAVPLLGGIIEMARCALFVFGWAWGGGGGGEAARPPLPPLRPPPPPVHLPLLLASAPLPNPLNPSKPL